MKDVIRLLRAMAEPTRLRLLRLLSRRELCVCELVDALQMPQYKISRHLRALRAAGLVEARRQGRWMHYRMGRQIGPAGPYPGLLKPLEVHMNHLPEAHEDDLRLRKRLALRRSGECVVGNRTC
jgi:ArsR family transcriptional regulator